jgi:TfoX/Sxy family transcriptional regulator of competence genes
MLTEGGSVAWKKPSLELSGVLDRALEGLDCRSKPMFGCPAYFVNDTWFAGVHEDHLLCRLPPDDQDRLMATHADAALFEPMPGRPMKEFMILPEAVWSDAAQLQGWLRRSFDYSAALPPKVRKPRKKKG